jgi:hypothetical protein
MITDADGFTLTRGGQPFPKVVCDGTPHGTPNNMVTCTKSANRYVTTWTRDGKQTSKSAISISDDGKIFTNDLETDPPDEAPYTITTIAERVSGGPGVAGDWREVKNSDSRENGMLTIAITADVVAYKDAQSQALVNCNLSGAESQIGSEGSLSMKLADPHTLRVTYKNHDGRVWRENTYALSEDGMTITEIDVSPAPSPSMLSVVFHKM